MTETFKNKTIWIIGASEGLGKSLAEQLAANGAQCILSARNQIKLEEVAQHIPNSTIAPLDVTDPISIQNAFDQIGPVDGIVYNAG
ncbi:MAG: SDR family NAD(P)-dependent oxidoreductase, partial [Planktomarina sp.]